MLGTNDQDNALKYAFGSRQYLGEQDSECSAFESELDSELASAAVDLRGLYREQYGLDSAPWETFDTAGGNLGVILSCARLTDLHLLAGNLPDGGYTQR